MSPFVLSLLTLIFAPTEATIVFAGDAMQHQGQLDAAKRADGSYDYSTCFTDVKDYVSDADYAVVNLETTLGASNHTGYPCFCSPDSWADALDDAGFDMMLTANNHTLDRRDKGLKRTIDVLDRKGIDHIGTYRNAAARDSIIPTVRDINGIKVGFLNYTYGTNGIKISGDAVVDYIDRAQIKKDIAATRSAGAEILVTAMHWGDEYKLLPNASQRSLADFLVAEGVDMVIGGHPHVVQPIEVRDNPQGRKSLVVWSLGNFISNMKTRDTRGGVMVKATIVRDGQAARFKEAEYRLVFTVPSTGGSTNYRLITVDSDSDHARAGAFANECRAFTASALSVFNTHNKGVDRHVADKHIPIIQSILKLDK
jgi:poly-gamma-glutamate synthesis protein (capsule biosynthesis protein)